MTRQEIVNAAVDLVVDRDAIQGRPIVSECLLGPIQQQSAAWLLASLSSKSRRHLGVEQLRGTDEDGALPKVEYGWRVGLGNVAFDQRRGVEADDHRRCCRTISEGAVPGTTIGACSVVEERLRPGSGAMTSPSAAADLKRSSTVGRNGGVLPSESRNSSTFAILSALKRRILPMRLSAALGRVAIDRESSTIRFPGAEPARPSRTLREQLGGKRPRFTDLKRVRVSAKAQALTHAAPEQLGTRVTRATAPGVGRRADAGRS